MRERQRMEDVLLRIGESTRSAAGDHIRLSDDVGYVGEEEETEKLEEVRELSEKLKTYRSTSPAHLKSTLCSTLISHRPQGPQSSSDDPNAMLSAHGDDVDNAELLRDNISSNIYAMPILINRINECISRIDELVSSNGTPHPELKWKKS
uniref:Uncharacterized protein n=1 Tax=Opuntia streptacantha TaxID=393608 RepID=A0A7C8ZWX4_OPUST